MKNLLKTIALFMPCLALQLSAGTLGDLTYDVVNGNTIRITDCNTAATGSIDIPATIESKPVVYIGDNAFEDCGQLTRISLPDSITHIGKYSFYECGGLSTFTIPNAVTNIGTYAFGDANLVSIFCEGDAPLLGEYALDGYQPTIYYMNGAQGFDETPWSSYNPIAYTNLFSFDVVHEEIVITDYLFSATGDVIIPNTIVGKPVVSVASDAFFNCRHITSISIPKNLTSFAQSSMRGATAIEGFTVDASNTTFTASSGILFDIDETQLLHAPANWTSDGNYDVPNSVTSVLQWAFLDCNNLHSVTFPNGFSNVENQAFFDCSNLTAAVFFGDAPTLGGSVFENTDTGFTVYHSDQQEGFTTNTWNGYPIESFDGNYSFDIYNDKASIEQYKRQAVEPVIIPDSFAGFTMTSIAGVAFVNHLTTSYYIPETVDALGEQSFQNNRNLKTIIIPKNVTYVLSWAFKDCNNLTTALFCGDAPGYFVTDAFANTATNFMVYYFSDNSGFSSPTWHGYPSTEIDRSVYPASEWLMHHELAYDTDLNDDISGDDVDLLMEYALDLDPNADNSGNMPKMFLNKEGGIAGISYHAVSEGVTYTVDTTTNLLGTWSTSGVSDSSIVNGMRSSYILTNAPQHFLRLKVEAAAP